MTIRNVAERITQYAGAADVKIMRRASVNDFDAHLLFPLNRIATAPTANTITKPPKTRIRPAMLRQ